MDTTEWARRLGHARDARPDRALGRDAVTSRAPITRREKIGLGLLAVFLALVLAWIAQGCALWPQRVPGHVIVLKNGTTYPCAHGVERDGYGYRCLNETSAVWPASYVVRVDP